MSQEKNHGVQRSEIEDAINDLTAGINADIWYDARQYGDASAEERISKTHNAMRFAVEALKKLAALDQMSAGNAVLNILRVLVVLDRDGISSFNADSGVDVFVYDPMNPKKVPPNFADLAEAYIDVPVEIDLGEQVNSDSLEQALTNEDWKVRLAAIERIERDNLDRSEDQHERALTDESCLVRAAAVKLGQLSPAQYDRALEDDSRTVVLAAQETPRSILCMKPMR